MKHEYYIVYNVCKYKTFLIQKLNKLDNYYKLYFEIRIKCFIFVRILMMKNEYTKIIFSNLLKIKIS